MSRGFAGVILTLALATVLAVCAWDFFRPVRPPSLSPKVDLIIVEKAAHRLTLLNNGRVEHVYQISIGRGGSGPKRIAGDNKVPEGKYRIAGRNSQSAYHLSLRIGYPTARQAAEGKLHGIDPGGDVMIHGIRRGLGWIGNLHRSVDWTRGCIAVTNAEIEQIWRDVPDGTAIIIKG